MLRVGTEVVCIVEDRKTRGKENISRISNMKVKIKNSKVLITVFSRSDAAATVYIIARFCAATIKERRPFLSAQLDTAEVEKSDQRLFLSTRERRLIERIRYVIFYRIMKLWNAHIFFQVSDTLSCNYSVVESCRTCIVY